MTPAMFHRGPDDEGYFDVGISDFGFRNADFGHDTSERERDVSRRSLSLGMRRLSIIDLEGGHQPIFNEAGNVGAVLNGEIYNFESLRKQLEDRGHTFRTRADSEVVAHGFEEWGPGCVERFEGMFALAVWDGRRANDSGQGGSLFLARDRMGIKPLYYYAEPVQSPKSKVQSLRHEAGPWTLDIGHWTRFLFASEVRTLLASGVVPRVLSRSALESYLLFGSVSEPMTLVENVVSLPPGHRMTVQLDSTRATFETERYWSIS
jgi:asparagine synthase (glutamine-hydrolysing)